MPAFTTYGTPQTDFMTWLTDGLTRKFQQAGYEYLEKPTDDIQLVLNLIDKERPRHFRRRSQATFVVSILEADDHDEGENLFRKAYPYLIRSLANHLIYAVPKNEETILYFLTPEQGFYRISHQNGTAEDHFFTGVFQRLEPLARSRLVIDNIFNEDLDEHLTNGNETTKKLSRFGKKLDEMNLLPAPFPIENYLTARDMRHLKKLYGIGGLSYGNLSSRENEHHFWMSASGIDKSNMKEIGRDILLIKGYDEQKNAIRISVPKKTVPKRASVDAIEHWMIYREHPEVGAVVHIHAWMDGVQATPINYPCGTIELAETVAELVRKSPDPSQAVIGLKNHGLTITGRSLDDIFHRIEGRVIPRVPMS